MASGNILSRLLGYMTPCTMLTGLKLLATGLTGYYLAGLNTNATSTGLNPLGTGIL